MVHDIEFVAKSQFLDIEEFRQFCLREGEKNGAFYENGIMRVSTLFVDKLLAAAIAGGVSSLTDAQIKDMYSHSVL